MVHCFHLMLRSSHVECVIHYLRWGVLFLQLQPLSVALLLFIVRHAFMLSGVCVCVCVVGVVDRLFARVGACDNVVKHMSTFHMEMAETAHILSNATPASFIIIDEIGEMRLVSKW